MPAPLAKGIIIAASIVVAAGIALYESPQVRQWVDQSRRKIAVALHSLGDDIQPRRPSESSDDFELRKRRREELIRRNRNELIRRAREEGIAVDLDELARIGSEDVDMAERRSRADRTKSFDDMVGSDGMLHNTAKTTAKDTSDNGLKKRGAAGFAAGAAAAVAMSNPFDDNNVPFDLDHEDEAPSPRPFTYVEPASRQSSATVEADSQSSPAPAAPLIDLTPNATLLQPETHDDADQAAQSFYSFTSSASHPDLPPAQPHSPAHEADYLSTGTLTPRSDRSHSLSTSADDIAILSMQNSTDHDARSEVFSEGGFTDAAFSEAGFSEFATDDRTGVMTPNSWTDVGSDDESEWGGAQDGRVSQAHI